MVHRRFIALALIAAGCPPPVAPRPKADPRADGTCADVAWSCVGMVPNTTEAWGCSEGNAVQLAQYQASCSADKGGRFALNPCLRDLAVGGCTLARGALCTTTWYHAPATTADVERACSRESAVLVAP